MTDPLHTGAIVAGVLAVQALVLRLMGRTMISRSGTVKFWHGVVKSAENSQHLTDWYTFTHVVHGFGFYVLLWCAGPTWPRESRMLAAVVLEAVWEVIENTPWIIDRYRADTISFDYYGDSVVNSLSDVVAMMVGFALAARLQVWATAALTLAMEAGLAWRIRDNLTLNLIMLIRPSAAIRRWQSRA